jgi:elongation factor Ts
MAITAESIKELREMTSCGVMECKKALEESSGDLMKAKEVLHKRGLEIAAKKGSREAREGRVEAYIHSGSKIGVLVEVNCETDFVAKNDDFVTFTRDLAMHIAAMNPRYLRQEDVPEDVLKEAKDPKALYKEICLVEQPFIKDPKKTVQDCVTGLVAKIGENIFIGRFSRFKVNESLS